MKIWRSGSQFVVERGDAFLVIDATGAITKRFESSTWSIEDELGEIHFTVNGKVLWEHAKIAVWGREDRLEDKVELDDLERDVSEDTRHFIAIALGDADVAQEEHRLRERAAADARVAAIFGASDDHRMGELFARAQTELIRRVHRYNDKLCEAILPVLVALGRAKVPATAAHAFACGCLHACFALDVPKFVDDEPVPLHALAGLVAPLVVQLEKEADYKDFMDAPRTAGAYWSAARAMREAARLLGG